MGKKTNKSKRGEVKNTDFQTPKNGSKRRQNFSPSGLTPEEKITKPGSTGPNGPGVTPPTSLSAGVPVNPSGHVPPVESPGLVSEAPSGGRRPGEDLSHPNVVLGSGGLGEGNHDLFRGASPSGPGASKGTTAAPSVEAKEGPSGPHCPGTSKGPAKGKAVIKLGQIGRAHV